MPETFQPTTFGRFYLFDLIAQGGMAEVFKARSYGADGFEKRFALKRILPNFADDERFLTMLADEARLAVQLNHSNIVQVLDFGKYEGRYYLSMEYVDGTDLSTLIKTVRRQGTSIPPAIAAYVVSEVCRGLDYAHRKLGPNGQPLGVVHRDVSTHNVLLSYEGEVKLTDFGIAKARTNLTHTQTGVIKGKLQYMAPEQARGELLDHRSDIFALGLVLYELLTLHPLFDGDSQTEILRRIAESSVTAEALPHNIPEPLRAILARALQQAPAERYAQAAEMQQALVAYLHQAAPDFVPEHLARFVRSVLAEQLTASQRRLDPPIDEATKQRLAQYSGGEVYAVARETEPHERRAPTKTVVEPHHASGVFWSTARSFSVPQSFYSLGLFMVADFLKPLVSLPPFFLAVFAIATITIYVKKIKRYRSSNSMPQILRSRVGEAFIFALIGLTVWTVATVASLMTPTRGVLAAKVEAVQEWQTELLGLRRDVAVIKETTQEIAKGVEEIKAAIANLSAQGGLIPHPSTAEEWYHNARYYELEGKASEAIAAYAEFLRREPAFVDVHEAYQILLRRELGAEAAEVRYAETLREHAELPVVQMMQARFLSHADRRAKVKPLAEAHPNFAPIFHELVQVQVDIGLGQMTTQMWRETKSWLDRWKTFEETHQLGEYYLDRAALSRLAEAPKTFEAMYNAFGAKDIAEPIMLRATQSASGVVLSLIAREGRVVTMLFSVDDPDHFRETGYQSYDNSLTGKPMPETEFVFTPTIGKHTVYAKYIDSNGAESPVQRLDFEVTPISVGDIAQPRADGMTKDLKLYFHAYPGYPLVDYFYSLDDEAANLRAEMERALVPNVSRGAHTVYVKGVTAAGEATKVYAFPVHVP